MDDRTWEHDPFDGGSDAAPTNVSFDIGQYVALLRDRWAWIAAAVGIGVAVGVANYFIDPKLYRAETTLQVSQRSLVPISSDGNPWLQQWANRMYLPTQYRLLESRGLAERVVDDLRLTENSRFAGRQRAAAVDGDLTADDDARFRADLASRLLGGLDVDPIQGTELVELTYVSDDPQLAALVANGFADTFIRWGKTSQTDSVRRASELIEAQIQEVKLQIDDKERQLQAYSQDTDIIALDPEANATLQRLGRLNQDYTAALSEALVREQRYRELQNTSDAALAAEAGGTGLATTLRQELVGLEADYANRLKTYKPDWPEMRELQGRIDEQRRLLDNEVASRAREVRQEAYAEWQGALGLVRRIEEQQQQAKSDTLTQNLEAVEFHNLQQEIATRREMLAELMAQLSQAGLSAGMNDGEGVTNVTVVDRALVPRSPFRPSLRRNVALGLGVGLIVGIGLVFALHFLDRTLKTPDEVQRQLGHPVLAVIPDLSSQSVARGRFYGYSRRQRATGPADPSAEIELVPETRPRLVVSEAYRSLRTALMLSSAEKLEVVTVTSAEAGEGKTTTSVNLAVVMAQLGRSVLLVDADLRKPRVHRIFKASNQVGLVSYLTGLAQGETAIQDTHIAGLKICPSGPIPPNPSELLASERMTRLLREMAASYDLVIVDSPPVLAVSDAILTAKSSDGVVLCLRAGKIHREEVRQCRERLRLAGVRILGAVFNRLQASGGYYRGPYHYYEAYSRPEAADPRAGSVA